MADKLKDELFQWAAKALAVLFFGWLCYELGKTDNSRLYNPREAVNGIDTIYYVDSMFKVKIQIDTAIELTEEQVTQH